MKDEYVIRLPEILLNKAEALAALGRNEEAINTIQELRKKRFRPEHLTAITETGAGLVQFIREERRRELCFEWHRWFDLRRYAVNKDLLLKSPSVIPPMPMDLQEDLWKDIMN